MQSLPPGRLCAAGQLAIEPGREQLQRGDAVEKRQNPFTPEFLRGCTASDNPLEQARKLTRRRQETTDDVRCALVSLRKEPLVCHGVSCQEIWRLSAK
jgi:hypothetical protein